MLQTTIGRLLVNEALPEDMRDYSRVLDGKSANALLQEVAERYPEKYRDVAKKLLDVGRDAAYVTGGMSFGINHIRTANSARLHKQKIEAQLQSILSNKRLSDSIDPKTGRSERESKIIDLLSEAGGPMEQDILKESLAEDNPLGHQVKSKARGNPTQLRSLRGGDLLYVDHHNNPIPVPILRSYSQGLTPAEYFAGSFGARKGVIDTKFATQEAGYFSKQLNQAAHRLIVTGKDSDKKPDSLRGLPVDTDDSDNVGSLLAHDFGPYKRNTKLTPQILNHLKDLGHDRVLIRSPAVGGAPDGGLYAADVGYRERGMLAPIGDNVGIGAAQALSEPVSQAQLSSKHSGGVAGAAKGVTGFKYINQLIQVPKRFPGGATHSQFDGKVTDIVPAPTGGHYVMVGNQEHYVGPDVNISVKVGDHVEAGDVLSEGIPNPAEVVQHKGIGEGRRYFTDLYRKAYEDSGITHHRRNIELLSRGLIDHVRLHDELGDYLPNDVIPYSALEHSWQPRPGFQTMNSRAAVGKYLERPVLHYTIGTQIKPSMVKQLEHFGVPNVTVHHEPPPFQPEMIRAANNLSHDPDWFTKMLGSNLKRNLLQSTWRGGVSNEGGTSFVPGLARAVDFGRTGLVKDWHDGVITGLK